jgi:hypothetical protein
VGWFHGVGRCCTFDAEGEESMSEYIWHLTQKELHQKLNFVWEQGVAHEREQIIAALGQYFGNTTAAKDKTISIKLGELIALIEGEN